MLSVFPRMMRLLRTCPYPDPKNDEVVEAQGVGFPKNDEVVEVKTLDASQE